VRAVRTRRVCPPTFISAALTFCGRKSDESGLRIISARRAVTAGSGTRRNMGICRSDPDDNRARQQLLLVVGFSVGAFRMEAFQCDSAIRDEPGHSFSEQDG